MLSGLLISITMYWTWEKSGRNFSTTFFMEGIKQRSGYNDKFLVQEGCEEGSKITMTENADMNEEL